ncbi:UNVERIFIED_CONTAM: hypothetical protein Sangu_2648400 [Sesamum angustifolium]|uniref:Uncharacterized protein n=1 Tax=Sesamum angustifolium TaxID=2727405 RepID=A0AAW2J4J2_9LAMI
MSYASAFAANHQALAAADSRLPADCVRALPSPSAHCLPACRVFPHIGRILCQPSASLPRAVRAARARAHSLPNVSAHGRLLAHARARLPTLTTDARPARPLAAQPVRTTPTVSSTSPAMCHVLCTSPVP